MYTVLSLKEVKFLVEPRTKKKKKIGYIIQNLSEKCSTERALLRGQGKLANVFSCRCVLDQPYSRGGYLDLWL